jgi:CheY-like chemotaxis protein
MKVKNTVPILVADDDLDDCMMIKEAFQESRLLNTIHFVHDGVELMKYLDHKREKNHPLPGLILLDLNMPKKDGRESLRELKSNPAYKQIPVVVLTTSQAEEDVMRTYNLGVNSFITKPVAFEALVQIMRDLGRYWFEIVELPDAKEKDGK